MSQDGYTLKEMMNELRLEAKDHGETLTRVCSSLDNIDKHLAQLNSKVATHEAEIGTLKSFQTKAGVVISIAVFFAITITNRVIAYIGI